MNIVIVGHGFAYPDGSGATARVEAFAKGLRACDCGVRVLCVKPTEPWNAKPKPASGIADGIPFEYTCGRRTTARSRIGAAWLYWRGLQGAMQAIRRIHLAQPVDVVYCWGMESPYLLHRAWRTASALGALLVAGKDDYPFSLHRKNAVSRSRRWYFEKCAYKYPDGLVCITSYLRDYYAPHLRKDARIIRIPIVVDTAAYSEDKFPALAEKPLVVYCGNLRHEEEIVILLRAFARVAADYPEWGVRVIGDTAHAPVMKKIPEMLEELSIEGRVHFIGAVARKEIPLRLLEGRIMALPRIAGTFSQAGFPTKLAEYLATARPVVVTATGDIPEYLRDGREAYLVPPGDVEAFAERLRYIMSHPQDAIEVGKRGRDLALREFDCTRQARRLLDFFRELRSLKTQEAKL